MPSLLSERSPISFVKSANEPVGWALTPGGGLVNARSSSSCPLRASWACVSILVEENESCAVPCPER